MDCVFKIDKSKYMIKCDKKILLMSSSLVMETHIHVLFNTIVKPPEPIL